MDLASLARSAEERAAAAELPKVASGSKAPSPEVRLYGWVGTASGLVFLSGAFASLIVPREQVGKVYHR